MPRATWKGFLRLSLVTCPVYLVPAATKTKAIRLHQVRMAPAEPEPDIEEEDERPPPRSAAAGASSERAWDRSVSSAVTDFGTPPAAAPEEAEPIGQATRIALQPVDRDTGEVLDRRDVRKGYEFDRGQFVTLSPQELKALDLESSHTVDLTSFVARAEVDPVYFNAPYYVHPDGKVAQEAFRVIAAAMTEAGVAGIGRVTMARRERQVLVEPRRAGMVLITLRAADEVRPSEFGTSPDDVDAEMITVARTIIERRTGHFDPSTFRDRYQEALEELIQAKLKGRVIVPAAAPAPSPVIDLMAALKRSLAAENKPAPQPKTARTAKRRAAAERLQPSLLLSVAGGGRKAPAEAAPRRRRKA